MKAFCACLVVALAATALAQDSPPPTIVGAPDSPPPPPLIGGPPSPPPPGPIIGGPPSPPPPGPIIGGPPRPPPPDSPSSPSGPPPAPAPSGPPPSSAPPPGIAPAPGPGRPPRRRSPPPPGTPAAPSPPPGTPASPVTPDTAGGVGSSGGGGGSGPSEADVLTFAFNLECLEGQFYSCAAFGTPLDTSITGNGPAPSSCKKATLNSTMGTYAAELAREETAHVKFLYTALKQAGASPVCPFVNIDTAFEKAAEAAFNSTTPLSPTFDPYANDVFFLHGSFIFEDLGASAYNGGVSFLSTAAYRAAATAIGNTESYHAGIIRTLLYQILDTVPAYGFTVNQITSAIVDVLNKLSGSPQLKYTLTNASGSSLANVDSQAFVPAASVTQVLQAVTLGAPAGSGGGFFPNNLNGNLKN